MADVISGFAVVFVVIAIGWVLARTGVLGDGAQRSMGLFVYYVAIPALLFDRVTNSDPAELFSMNLVVTALSSLTIGIAFFLLSFLILRRRAPDSIIGMLAASYANAGNLGIPLAAYVLGDATAAVPLIMFQVALYAPVSMTILDMLTSKNPSLVRNLVITPLTNTMVLASIAGLLVVFLSLEVPNVIAEPIGMLADSSVPVALIVFGMGLYGTRVLQKGEVERVDVWLAALFKNILHPIVAYFIGLAFGLSGHDLLTVVVIAALPTAQNVYTYALRFRTAENMARDSGVVTTLGSFVVMLAIPVFLA